MRPPTARPRASELGASRSRPGTLAGALALVAWLVLAVAAASAQPAGRAPLVISDGGEEASILADQIEQVGGAQDLLIATGNVEITQGASRLLADRVELNRDTGLAVAQGKVVFFDGQDRLVGDRVDYNLRTGTGVVYDGSAFSAPYYRLSGERMDRIGEGVYRVRRGVFTTCEGDDPVWAFRMGSATADLDEGLYGTSGSFWVKSLPLIPYVPFFAAAIRRERQSGFLFPEFGNSSTKGVYAKVPYYWAISDSQDLTVSLDVFTRRGVGGEGEYRYILSENARGIASGFLMPEVLRDAQDRERLDIPLTRGFGSLKHNWQITPRLSFKVDANGVTDDQVWREYGDRLPERSQERAETNVFVTQRWDAWALTANVLWYQDLTTPAAVELQRTPEIQLFGVRQPVPGLPGLLYEMESSFTNFYRVVGDSGVRLDLHPLVSLPIPVAGLFTVTPFAGGRLTYYNQRAVGQKFTHGVWVEDTVYDPHVRRQIEGGVELETRAARVWNVDGWGGLSAVQHLIEPRVTYLMIRGFDQKNNPQYDPFIDRIGRVTHVIYSITNRLNAKTLPLPGAEAVRWEAARLTLFQTFDIDRALYETQPFKDLRAQLIIDPHAHFRFRADATYNVYGLGLRTAIADVTAHYRDAAVAIGSRYDAISGTNYVVGAVGARVLNNVDVRAITNWDVASGTFVENRVGIDWRFQCFALMAEYVARHDDENEFRFAVSLLGVGTIGSSLGAGP
jgi:LPS-assembly protein